MIVVAANPTVVANFRPFNSVSMASQITLSPKEEIKVSGDEELGLRSTDDGSHILLPTEMVEFDPESWAYGIWEMLVNTMQLEAMPVKVATTLIQHLNRRVLEIITDSMVRLEDLEERETQHFILNYQVSILREIVVWSSKAICCSKAEVS